LHFGNQRNGCLVPEATGEIGYTRNGGSGRGYFINRVAEPKAFVFADLHRAAPWTALSELKTYLTVPTSTLKECSFYLFYRMSTLFTRRKS
jgi:hypothetical protein